MENNYIQEQYQLYLGSMEDSPLKTYVEKRVIDQISWYDKKSAEQQKMFKTLTIAVVILNALIPCVTLFSEYGILAKLFITGFSSAAGAISAIIAICAYKELWIEYRTNCELLKSTLHRFFLRTGEFKQIADDEVQLKEALVMSCEEYLTKEFQTWSVIVARTDEGVHSNNHSRC